MEEVKKGSYKELLAKKVQLAKDCRYFIEKQINPNCNIDDGAEQRRKNDVSLPISDIDMALYCFRENFFRTIGKAPIGNRLADHSEQVMEFLNNTFPFCFNINIRDDLFELAPDIKDFSFDLAFYAMSLGATDEQMATLKDALKKEHIVNVYRMEREKPLSVENNYRRVSLDDVQGTTTRIYQADNLFDVISKINDKNVSGFIQYIMQNGGIENSQVVFGGMHFNEDQNGKLYISEGNHRFFVYKLLKKVKEHITGKPIEGMKIDAGISRIRILPEDEDVLKEAKDDGDDIEL